MGTHTLVPPFKSRFLEGLKIGLHYLTQHQLYLQGTNSDPPLLKAVTKNWLYLKNGLHLGSRIRVKEQVYVHNLDRSVLSLHL